MPKSRGIIVLGMHRSGTSAVTRGLQALGVNIGDTFIETRFDNPTGYWENPAIFDLNERLLHALGTKWEDPTPIAEAKWSEPVVEGFHREAVEAVRTQFLPHPSWAFKDPRTLRLLPFWQPVFRELAIEEAYLVVLRNPLSVARSLFERQYMDLATGHKLWLAYLCPHLDAIAERPFTVIDYDLFVEKPREQLDRLSRRFGLTRSSATGDAVDEFVDGFLDIKLRHSVFGQEDFDMFPHVGVLTREAYLLLRTLATSDEPFDTTPFWLRWRRLRGRAMRVLAAPNAPG